MTETIFTLVFIWLVGLLFLLIAYDIYAITHKKITISWIIFTTSQKWPIVPALMGLIVGILIGHLFFPIPIAN